MINSTKSKIIMVKQQEILDLFVDCYLVKDKGEKGLLELDTGKENGDQFSSVQFSHSVVSDSLRPHGLQHSRPLYPSLNPRVYSNSCPLSQWCHPTNSSSVIPFSSCLQSFQASESFQMSHFFASGDQSIGVSASTSVLAMNIQDWFPLGWTGWIFLQSKGLSRVFSNISKASFLQRSAFFIVQLSHPYMSTGKTIALLAK